MVEIKQVDDSNFQSEVLESRIPVVADFYAIWCGPCKALAPIIESIAKDYQGKIKVVKIDTDKALDTATKYGVLSIPTVIFFKDGQEVSRSVGAVSRQVLEEHIKKFNLK